MPITYAILTTGSEILDGRVLDTNSNFIIEELSTVGVAVKTTLCCGDDQGEIIRALEYLHPQVDGIVVTGGLGPTTDDVTRYAIGAFAGTDLLRDERTVQKLEAYARERNRVLNPTNYRQAEFPRGAAILQNNVGTAPGFLIGVRNKPVFSLPGVPFEMKAMLREGVLPQILQQHAAGTALFRKPLKIFGLPESEVGSRIESCNLPVGVDVSYRVVFPEIHVILKSRELAELERIEPAVRSALREEYVYATELEKSFEEVVHTLLNQRGLSIAVAESMTGGRVGEMCTAVPGSSRTFRGGFLTYSDQMKVDLLQVSAELIQERGAVSAEVAEEMAVSTSKKCGADIGVSVTGVAGPGPDERQIPAGTFFIGYTYQNQRGAVRFFYPTGRRRIQTIAAYAALDTVRRLLLGYRLGTGER